MTLIWAKFLKMKTRRRILVFNKRAVIVLYFCQNNMCPPMFYPLVLYLSVVPFSSSSSVPQLVQVGRHRRKRRNARLLCPLHFNADPSFMAPPPPQRRRPKTVRPKTKKRIENPFSLIFPHSTGVVLLSPHTSSSLFPFGISPHERTSISLPAHNTRIFIISLAFFSFPGSDGGKGLARLKNYEEERKGKSCKSKRKSWGIRQSETEDIFLTITMLCEILFAWANMCPKCTKKTSTWATLWQMPHIQLPPMLD